MGIPCKFVGQLFPTKYYCRNVHLIAWQHILTKHKMVDLGIFSFSSACGYSALFASENINAMSSFVTGQQTRILPTMFVDLVGGRNLSR